MKTTTTLQRKFEEYPNLSLRRLSQIIEANYNMMLKASKKPKPNEIYDPTSTNFEEVEAYIIKKIGKEVFDNLNWEEIASTIMGSASERIAKTIEDFEVGSCCIIRGFEDIPYTILAKTTTHIILMPLYEKISTQPRLFSIPTFLHQTPKLFKEEEV